MNQVNLKRARIVELKHKSGGWPAVAIHVSEGLWAVSGFAYKQTTDVLLSRFDIVKVLDELPEPTLADLLPKGCTEFRFTTPAGILRVALQHPTGSWEVTGLSSIWSSVADLQRGFDIDLKTVVPLSPHPDWIEAQR